MVEQQGKLGPLRRADNEAALAETEQINTHTQKKKNTPNQNNNKKTHSHTKKKKTAREEKAQGESHQCV